MKKYIVPEVEFVELSNHQILTTSCNPYYCPNMYGDSCAGHCYTDTVCTANTCTQDICYAP